MFSTPEPSYTSFIFGQIAPVFFLFVKVQLLHFHVIQLILDIFYIYTHKKVFFDCAKCLVIFNQSHVYKLVIFQEFTLFNVIFSCFSPTFLKFFFILSYFFLPNDRIKFFMTYFHVNQYLGYYSVNTIEFAFSHHKNLIMLFLFVSCYTR